MDSHPQPKTLEEHREYLYEIVKLKLWFLHHWLENHPEECFKDVLRNRVDIYRKTSVNPGTLNPDVLHWEDPRWQSMEMAAESTYHKYIHDRESFEEKAFPIFKDTLDERCERDFTDRSEGLRYQCGCFRHNPTVSADNNRLGFHIANFCRPYSFMDYPNYMKGCFEMLLDRAEFIFHADAISTGSWLNSMQRWLDWFPQEWIDHLQPPNKNVQWHYGFWGSFITARGTFNFKYGKILRETGELPFYPRYSYCSLKAMRDKLATI
ncbi:MAG: hypothetical protein J6X55_07210 [Victivallales bacterium]|nr:hypothetical protein [Victivallales bacterium]